MTPEPPVTADHTPERLSAEERRALADSAFKSIGCNGYGVHRVIDAGMFTTVERILAAHLADVEARLAAVETLADQAHEAPIDLIHEQCPAGGVGPGRECTACSAAGRAYLIGVEHVQRGVRAALHPDPSKPAGAKS